jgi:hypothetical protein
LHVKNLALVGILAVAGVAASANASEFRVRFVERVGNADVAIADPSNFDVSNGNARRIRVQFGVFDDAAGAAPAGGYLGWNVGTITVNGGAGNSDEFRNSSAGVHNGVGRLTPFNFAPASGGANGLPPANPPDSSFEALTAIDNTLGQQAFVWEFGNPQPQPRVFGLNTYVSTYEISVRPNAGALSYTIDFGGNVLAALEWRVVGEPIPPEDPDNDGSVTYAPFADAPRAFTAVLNVVVPAPGAAALLGLGGLVAIRRRR